MQTPLTITGYQENCECEHCGQKLQHGIKLDDGRVVGAICFDKKMTRPRVDTDGRTCRYGVEFIIKIAKQAQRLSSHQSSSMTFAAQ